MVLLSVVAGVRAGSVTVVYRVKVDDGEKPLQKHTGKKCLESAPVQRLHLHEYWF